MRLLTQALPGVVAGCITSLVLTWLLVPRPEPEAAPASNTEVVQKETVGSDDLRSLLISQALRANRDAVGTSPAKKGEPAEDDGADPEWDEPVEVGPTPQEALAELNDNYEQQDVDPNWAASAARSLSTDFDQYAGELGFALSGVECRSDSCRATLEFPSYAAAHDKMMHLTGRGYSVPCSTGASIPPPEDPSQPYQMELFLLDCDKGQDS